MSSYNNISQFAYKYKMVTPNNVQLPFSASEILIHVRVRDNLFC